MYNLFNNMYFIYTIVEKVSPKLIKNNKIIIYIK